MTDVEEIGRELGSILDRDSVRSLGRRLIDAEPIAIVAGACRYPGGIDSLEGFWEFMEAGRDAVGEVSPRRWDLDRYWDKYSRAPGKTYSRWAALFDDLSGFEPAFFGIAPKDAERLDPQQRLMLELGWEAFERAGWSRKRLSGAAAGVFVGAFSQDWFDLQHGGRPFCEPEAALGSQLGLLAARLSYWLDLHGPAMVIETACSSSLVALHLAAQSLRLGECDVALAGGVQLFLTPRQQIMCSQLQMLSPRGRCHVFDDSADGLALGEGAGVVVLERLSDALAAGDPILGLLRGSAVNQDGRTLGISAPNPRAQQSVLELATRLAMIDPADIGYIEAHGTGTAIGDPCELESIHRVYGSGGKRCFIGSSKANLAHTVAAAGIAGVFRALGVLHRKRVPGQLHYHTPNHRYALSETRFAIAMTPTEHATSLVAVSSFGNSGTNAHVILEKPPERAHTPVKDRPWIYVVSEPDAGSQTEALHRHAEALAGAGSTIGEWASTACVRRTRHRLRTTTVARHATEVATRLRDAAARQRWTDSTSPPRLVYLFPGHGAQREGMGEGLLEYAVAAETIDCVNAMVSRELRLDLRAAMAGRCPIAALDEQLLIFSYQVALWSLWTSWGIVPDVVIGHSMGEIAAAVACGGLSLEDATSVMIERRRAIADVPTRGGLAVAELARDEAVQLCHDLHGVVELAAHNSPRTVVFGAPTSELDALIERIGQERRFAKRVRIPFPAHTRWVDGAARVLGSRLSHLRPRATLETRFVSTVQTSVPLFGADYWRTNLRGTVEFDAAFSSVLEPGPETLVLEVSPLPVLGRAVLEIAERAERTVHVDAVRRSGDEVAAILEVAARTHERGIELDWGGLGYDGFRAADLPTHPWQHRRYWSVPSRVSASTTIIHVSPAVLAVMREHRVDGESVLPGSCLLDLVVRDRGRSLRDIRFSSLCPASSSAGDGLTLTMVDDEGALSLLCDGTPLLDCTLSVRGPGVRPDRLETPDFASPEFDRVHVAAFYEAWRTQHGVDYGPAFRAIEALAVRQGEAWAWIDAVAASGPAAEVVEVDSTVLHPVVLDACLHAAGVLVSDFFDEQGLLPVGIASLIVRESLPPRVFVRVIARGDLLFDLTICAPGGDVVVQIEGLRVQRLGRRREAATWVPRWAEVDEMPAHRGLLCVLGPDAGVVRQRCHALGMTTTHEANDATVLVADLTPRPEDAATDTVVRAFNIVQSLVQGREHPRHVVFVTCQPSADRSSAALAAYGGMANALSMEFPTCRWTNIELGALSDLDVALRAGSGGAEDRLRVRNGRVEALRWQPHVPDPKVAHSRWSDLDTVLVSGGTGGVGKHLTQVLLDAGVRHIVTLARRRRNDVVDSSMQTQLEVDVRDPIALAAALDRVRAAGHRIEGVIHAAGINIEGSFLNHDREMIETAVSTKVEGAAYLAEACGVDSLRFFCVLTSLSGTLGSEGQAAYAAANAALEGLVLRLRESGMPALACSFGPWHATGMLAARPDLEQRFVALGVTPMSPRAASAAFLRIVRSSEPLILVADLDISRWIAAHPTERHRPCWSWVETESTKLARSESLPLDLTKLGASERRTAVDGIIRSALADVLGLGSPDGIEEHCTLVDLGVTSLTALDLRDRIESSLGIRIPSTTLWRQPNLPSVVDTVLARGPCRAELEPSATDLDDLEAGALQALLVRELAELDV